MPKKTIVIIGLGLMGGSLGLALKKKLNSVRIFGISRSSKKIKQALRKGVIDAGSTRLKDIPPGTELVIIATPVPQIVPIALEIDRVIKVPLVVTDVGSTKKWILKELGKSRLKNVKFIGSHPMAGDHETGLEFARDNLYENALVFIIRDHTSPGNLKKIESFWRSVGANRLITLSAEDHDRIVSDISHLPHLVASLLTLCVSSEKMVLSGPGFKDATRIAQGDPELWTGIISTNPSIISSLQQFEKQIKKLRLLIQKKDWKALHRLLKTASRRRRAFNSNLK